MPKLVAAIGLLAVMAACGGGGDARHLASAGPDLATVRPGEGTSGQPVAPYRLVATDTDSPCPALRFSAAGLPEGLVLAAGPDCTATVSGTLRAPPGRYPVTYQVVDESGGSDTSVAVFVVRSG
jgi:hypothetical protein